MANLKNSGSKPSVELIKEKPEAAAALSKAVNSVAQARFDVKKGNTYDAINQGKIKAISDRQKDRLKENENILDLFPDILLAEQIIVSSILSPKDMLNSNLIYQTRHSILPSTVQTRINECIKTHIEGYYNLEDELPEILKNAIFRTGSYVSAVIPEAAVDEIINGKTYSMESHHNYIGEIVNNQGKSISLGILGPSVKESSRTTALEDFFSGNIETTGCDGAVKLKATMVLDEKEPNKKEDIFIDSASTEAFLEITDNFQILKLPKLTEAIANQRLKRAIKYPKYSVKLKQTSNVSLESSNEARDTKNQDFRKLTDSQFKDLVYKNAQIGTSQFTIFPSKSAQKRYSVGRPLRMRIPSEAVVPVYPPGEPSKHRGYFVLVDVDGNWITRGSVDTSYQGLQGLISNSNAANSLTSMLMNKSRQALTDNNNTTIVDNMLEIYSSIVENDMLNRLRNGMYGAQFEIGRDKEWDRIMLARALAGKMTRLVYIPSEFITYYAFDYHANGVGRSYLDQVKILTSLLAILIFSRTMAEMKNAINVTKVDITFDPKDPDPRKTIDVATNDIMRLREQYFPLGVNSLSDLTNWIQRAGLMFGFKGHPGLPETTFEFSTANMEHKVPDSETVEDLRKRIFMAFGLTPEQVDNGFGPEFATTAVQQNILFAKRILLLSNVTSSHVTSDVKNICSNDTTFLEELLTILTDSGEEVIKKLSDEEKENYRKDSRQFLIGFMDRVIENIYIDLPKPEVLARNMKMSEFKEHSEFVDAVLDSFVSEEVFPASFAGDIATHATEIKKFWKHYLLRKWVTEEGILPDISELFKRDEDGKPETDILESMDAYSKDVLRSAINFIKKQREIAKATDKDLQELGIPTGSLDSSTSSTDDSSGTSGLFNLDNPENSLDETTESTTGSANNPEVIEEEESKPNDQE